MVSKDALDNAGVDKSWSESSVSTSDEGGGGGGGGVGIAAEAGGGSGVSRSGRKAKLGFGRGGYGLVGVVGDERTGDSKGDIDGAVDPFIKFGIDGARDGVCEVKLGDRDGTGGSSGGGDVGGGAADATELHGWLSSYNGKRPIGTPLRYCDWGRLARGSGSWGAVGNDR